MVKATSPPVSRRAAPGQPSIRPFTAASNASPRASKLANRSKLAQAGASSTVSPGSASVGRADGGPKCRG